MGNPTNHRSGPTILVLLLGIAATTCLSIYFAFNCKTRQSRPSALSGQWQIVGIDGEMRGTAMLSADGNLDTNDDYTGVWTVDDSAVHLVLWEKRPHDSNGNYAATPDVHSLRIQQSPTGQVALSGEHVVLRRLADNNS